MASISPRVKPKIAFGEREVLSEPRYALATEPLPFDWLAASADNVPYHQQGDKEWDTAQNLAKRNALRKDKRVQSAVQRVWTVFEKNERMEVSKKSYIDFLVRICKLVIPDFELARCTETAEADWLRDSKGADSLSYAAFFDAFFELADIWCPGVDALEYSTFLDTLLKRLTVMEIQRPNGEVVRKTANVVRVKKADLAAMPVDQLPLPAAAAASNSSNAPAAGAGAGAKAGASSSGPVAAAATTKVPGSARSTDAAPAAATTTPAKATGSRPSTSTSAPAPGASSARSNAPAAAAGGSSSRSAAGHHAPAPAAAASHPAAGSKTGSRPPSQGTKAPVKPAGAPVAAGGRPSSQNAKTAPAASAGKSAAAAHPAASRSAHALPPPVEEEEPDAEEDALGEDEVELAHFDLADVQEGDVVTCQWAKLEELEHVPSLAVPDDDDEDEEDEDEEDEDEEDEEEEEEEDEEDVPAPAPAHVSGKPAHSAAAPNPPAQVARQQSQERPAAPAQVAYALPPPVYQQTADDETADVSHAAAALLDPAASLSSMSLPDDAAASMPLSPGSAVAVALRSETRDGEFQQSAPTSVVALDGLTEAANAASFAVTNDSVASVDTTIVPEATSEDAAADGTTDVGASEEGEFTAEDTIDTSVGSGGLSATSPAAMEFRGDDSTPTRRRKKAVKKQAILARSLARTMQPGRASVAKVSSPKLVQLGSVRGALSSMRNLRSGLKASLQRGAAGVQFLQPRSPTAEEEDGANNTPFAVPNIGAPAKLGDFPADAYHSDDDLRNGADQPHLRVWIVGKPGCGKSTVAKRVAEACRVAYLEPGALLQAAITNAADTREIVQQARAALIAGQAVPRSVAIELVRQAVIAAAVKGEGYVLDGFPANPDEFAMLSDPNGLPEGITAADLLPRHVVHLRLRDEDLVQRRLGARVHPASGQLLTADDVARLSKVVRAAGDGDADGDPLDAPVRLGGQVPAPLVRRPEDVADHINGNLAAWNKSSLRVDGSHIAVSSNQAPDDVYEEVMIALGEGLPPFSRLPFKAVARRLPLPEDVAGADVGTQRSWLLYGELPDLVETGYTVETAEQEAGLNAEAAENEGDEEADPAAKRADPDAFGPIAREELRRSKLRYWSVFRGMCPVAQADSGALLDGKTELAAEYRGRVYLMSTPERLDAFLANPERYVRRRPRLPTTLRVAVSGPVRAGSSTAAAAIGKACGLAIIGVAAVLQQRADAAQHLSNGGALPDSYVAAAVAEAIANHSASAAGKGWVLDGWPYTADQWKALQEAGVGLDNAVLLQPTEGWPAAVVPPQAVTLEAAGGTAKLPLGPSAAAAAAALPDLETGLRAANVEVRKIPCGPPYTEELLAAVAVGAVDPFATRADSSAEVGAAPASTQRPGDTGVYDPVEVQAGVLVPGNLERVVRVKDAMYWMIDDANLLAVSTNPARYLPDKPPVVPAARILVLAPRGSAVVGHRDALASAYGLLKVQPEAAVLNDAQLGAAAAAGLAADPPVPIAAGALAKVLRDAYLSKTGKDQGVLVEWDLVTPEQLAGVWEAKAPPAVILSVQVDESDVVARRVVAEFSWSPPEPAPPNEDGEVPPPPTAAELEEMQSTALAAAKERFSAEFNADVERITAVTDGAKNSRIIVLQPLDGTGNQKRVYDRLVAALEPYLRRQYDPFARAYRTPLGMAAHLVRQGRHRMSKFGPYCPVTLEERPGSAPLCGLYPVVYRQHVYMCESPAAAGRMVLNPERYVNQPPAAPWVPHSAAIVGPPCSGVSSAAKTVAADGGCELVTPATAVDFVVKGNKCALQDRVKKELSAGRAVAGELLGHCVIAQLSGSRCKTKGWLLDGYPQTADDAQQLEAGGFIPRVLFVLDLPDKHVMQRAAQRRATGRAAWGPKQPLPSDWDLAVVGRSLQRFHMESPAMVGSYLDRFENVTRIPAEGSKWQVSSAVSQRLQQATSNAARYLRDKQVGRAAPIADVIMPTSHMLAQRGFMGGYCPVRWATKRELVQAHGRNARTFGAQYNGQLFHMAGQAELDAFCAHPTRYLHRQRLPQHLPRRIPVGEMIVQGVALKGYCPVAMAEEAGWAGLKKGHPTAVVEYANCVYALSSEENLAKFMRTPEKYAHQKLPASLPPTGRRLAAAVTDLRNNGNKGLAAYVEQTTATLLTEALTSLEKLKDSLKHPRLTVGQSIAMYVSLYLKAHNVATGTEATRKRQRARLDLFLEECTLRQRVSTAMPRGSGITAARQAAESRQLGSRFDDLLVESTDSLRKRFLLPASS